MSWLRRPLTTLACSLLLALMAGCATTGSASASSPSPADPLEGMNRVTYAFNEQLDQFLLKPLAEGYRKYVPELAREGIDNFYGNFSDAWSTINHLLQAKPESAARMGMRVVSNTVFGLGGLLDPATEMGLERQQEDLGQTLGRWGVPPGPYLVLPLFGPWTLRDASAIPLERWSLPSYWMDDQAAANVVVGLQLVNRRASLLGASRMLDEIALDKYSFLRDAYLARRRSQVYDGDPPDEPGAAEEPAAEPAAPGK
jgi:phospholipid-binding lipoprotein MlaA